MILSNIPDDMCINTAQALREQDARFLQQHTGTQRICRDDEL